jgi:hypothetical protein
MVVNSEKTVRKIVSLSRDVVTTIETFRFSNHIKTESEAIRRLIELGLKAAATSSKPKPKAK